MQLECVGRGGGCSVEAGGSGRSYYNRAGSIISHLCTCAGAFHVCNSSCPYTS